MPLVSVIMPAYNAEKTIDVAIESVLKQTVSDFELIIIDDGSTDNTNGIVNKYADMDNRVVALANGGNRGVSYTRNYAVSIAQGEWIAFLDSDDAWQPTKLERQLQLSQKHIDSFIIYTGSSFIDEGGIPYRHVMHAEDKITYRRLIRKNLISCSSVMVKTRVMQAIKMPGDKMHEDYYCWLKILEQHMYAYGVDEPLLIYRLSSKSKSSNRIKSAVMLYRTYRVIGYSVICSCWLVFLYTFYSIKKRHAIYSSGKITQ